MANYGSNTVAVLLNTGSGTFANAVTYSTGGSEPRSLAAGDLNGGGHPDLVVGNYSSDTVGILLNKGNGTFSRLRPIAPAAPIRAASRSPTSTATAASTWW